MSGADSKDDAVVPADMVEIDHEHSHRYTKPRGRAAAAPDERAERLLPRWKRYEKRKAAKRRVWHAEAATFEVVDLLHDEGFLDDWRTSDPAQIQSAWQRYVDALLRVRG